MNDFYFDHTLESITDKFARRVSKKYTKRAKNVGDIISKIDNSSFVKHMRNKEEKNRLKNAELYRKRHPVKHTPEEIEFNKKRKDAIDKLYSQYHVNSDIELKHSLFKDVYKKMVPIINKIKKDKNFINAVKKDFENNYDIYGKDKFLIYEYNLIDNPNNFICEIFDENEFIIEVVKHSQAVSVSSIWLIQENVKNELNKYYNKLFDLKILDITIAGDGDEGTLEVKINLNTF